MTYRQLIEAVGKLLAPRSYNVTVSFWHHSHIQDDRDNNKVEWRIWDAVRGEGFEGATPEMALRRLENRIEDDAKKPEGIVEAEKVDA